MKRTIDREWFERRVQLEEGLDVTAGPARPEPVQDPAEAVDAGPIEGAERIPQPARRARRGSRGVARPL